MKYSSITFRDALGNFEINFTLHMVDQVCLGTNPSPPGNSAKKAWVCAQGTLGCAQRAWSAITGWPQFLAHCQVPLGPTQALGQSEHTTAKYHITLHGQFISFFQFLHLFTHNSVPFALYIQMLQSDSEAVTYGIYWLQDWGHQRKCLHPRQGPQKT